MAELVKATGQWMNKKTVVEYADTPSDLMAAIEERRDPRHGLACEDVLNPDHKYQLEPGFRGLKRGTSDEMYAQLWGMF